MPWIRGFDGISTYLNLNTAALYPDVVAILRQEIEDLVAEGVAYIQIDAPRYTYFVDERWRQRIRDQGEDPEAIIDEWIEADNSSLSKLDLKETILAMHLCRGNNRGGWFGEGGYGPIAEKIFNAIDVDRFLLEFDSDRSRGFEPLQHIPKHKTVVLGLITTKTGPPENLVDLLRRVDEAARFFPMEDLAISPNAASRHSSKATPCLGISNAESWNWWRRRRGRRGGRLSCQRHAQYYN